MRRKVWVVIMHYCDYLAALLVQGPEKEAQAVIDSWAVDFDLNPDGSYRSSKKTIRVVGKNRIKYKVTIEVDNG